MSIQAHSDSKQTEEEALAERKRHKVIDRIGWRKARGAKNQRSSIGRLRIGLVLVLAGLVFFLIQGNSSELVCERFNGRVACTRAVKLFSLPIYQAHITDASFARAEENCSSIRHFNKWFRRFPVEKAKICTYQVYIYHPNGKLALSPYPTFAWEPKEKAATTLTTFFKYPVRHTIRFEEMNSPGAIFYSGFILIGLGMIVYSLDKMLGITRQLFPHGLLPFPISFSVELPWLDHLRNQLQYQSRGKRMFKLLPGLALILVGVVFLFNKGTSTDFTCDRSSDEISCTRTIKLLSLPLCSAKITNPSSAELKSNCVGGGWLWGNSAKDRPFCIYKLYLSNAEKSLAVTPYAAYSPIDIQRVSLGIGNFIQLDWQKTYQRKETNPIDPFFYTGFIMIGTWMMVANLRKEQINSHAKGRVSAY